MNFHQITNSGVPKGVPDSKIKFRFRIFQAPEDLILKEIIWINDYEKGVMKGVLKGFKA